MNTVYRPHITQHDQEGQLVGIAIEGIQENFNNNMPPAFTIAVDDGAALMYNEQLLRDHTHSFLQTQMLQHSAYMRSVAIPLIKGIVKRVYSKQLLEESIVENKDPELLQQLVFDSEYNPKANNSTMIKEQIVKKESKLFSPLAKIENLLDIGLGMYHFKAPRYGLSREEKEMTTILQEQITEIQNLYRDILHQSERYFEVWIDALSGLLPNDDHNIDFSYNRMTFGGFSENYRKKYINDYESFSHKPMGYDYPQSMFAKMLHHHDNPDKLDNKVISCLDLVDEN